MVWSKCASRDQYGLLRTYLTLLFLAYLRVAHLDYACMLLHELCTNLGLVSRLASLFYEEALRLRSRYDSSGWLNSQGSLILMLVLLRIELKELLLGRGLSHAHWVIDGCGDVFADGADTGRSHRHGLSRVLDCRVGFVESFESRPLLDCITQFVF